MRPFHFALLCLLFSATGCTHQALRRSTLDTAGTYADLQYQQVLNNLARFAWDRESLPSQLYVITGVVQVSDTVTPGVDLPWKLGEPARPTVKLSGSRQWTEKWDVKPVSTSDELRRLQRLYRSAVDQNRCPPGGGGDSEPPDTQPADQPTTRPTSQPVGKWLHFGRPPAEALFSGRYRNSTVYVTKDGVRGLTQLTLQVLGGKENQPQFLFPSFNGPALNPQ